MLPYLIVFGTELTQHVLNLGKFPAYDFGFLLYLKPLQAKNQNHKIGVKTVR